MCKVSVETVYRSTKPSSYIISDQACAVLEKIYFGCREPKRCIYRPDRRLLSLVPAIYQAHSNSYFLPSYQAIPLGKAVLPPQNMLLPPYNFFVFNHSNPHSRVFPYHAGNYCTRKGAVR